MEAQFSSPNGLQDYEACDFNPNFGVGRGKSYFPAAQHIDFVPNHQPSESPMPEPQPQVQIQDHQQQLQPSQQQHVFRDKPACQLRPFTCMSFIEFFRYLDEVFKVSLKDSFIVLQFDRTSLINGFTFYIFKLIDIRKVSTRQTILDEEHRALCQIFYLSSAAIKFKTMAEKYRAEDKEKGMVKYNLFCLKDFTKCQGTVKGQDEYYTYYKFIHSPVMPKNTKTLLAAYEARKKENGDDEDPEPVDVLALPKVKKTSPASKKTPSTTSHHTSSTTNATIDTISEEE